MVEKLALFFYLKICGHLWAEHLWKSVCGSAFLGLEPYGGFGLLRPDTVDV